MRRLQAALKQMKGDSYNCTKVALSRSLFKEEKNKKKQAAGTASKAQASLSGGAALAEMAKPQKNAKNSKSEGDLIVSDLKHSSTRGGDKGDKDIAFLLK